MPRYNKGEGGIKIIQDWGVLALLSDDPETARFYQLTDRQCSALIAIAEFLAFKTRYENLSGAPDLRLFADDTKFRLMNPIDPGECQTFPPFAEFITYEPNDPYRTPDLIPDGYVFPPWYIANTAAEVTYDAQLGAAVTTLERLPALTPLSGFPRFRVTVNGIGKVTLHFAAVNLGGMAQITIDDDVTTIELIDLIQDKIAIPPETANIIEKEYYFGVAGEHRVDVIMLPALQDQIPPVMFGGGLAGVTLCGFGLALAQEGIMLRQSPTDDCILEQSADGETWTEAFNFAQCPSIASGDDVAGITVQNKIQQYAAQQQQSKAAQEQYEADYTGNPSSVNPDAPDDNFDGGGTPEETRALCAAITAYVHALAYAKIQQLDVIYAAGAGLLALAAFLTGGLAFVLAIAANIAIGGAALAAGLSYIAARNALSDQNALDDVACCMNDVLIPLAISEANWNTALTGCSWGAGSNQEIVRGFIADSLAANYLTFVDMLGEANKASDEGTPLDCACDVFSPVSYAVVDCIGGGAGGSGTIAFVSGDEYDVELIAEATGGFSAHIREQTGQLFAYRNLGTVNTSAVRNADDSCTYAGVGGGAINQNQYLKELTLYDTSAHTVRIRFYTPTE
jgi:hypothetical protein